MAGADDGGLSREVMDVVIKVGGVVAAGSAIFALLIKLFKWAMAPQEIKARIDALEKKQEEDRKTLAEKEEKDRDTIQSENALICFGLSACLDGLMQLGVNHNVPKAKEKLDNFINLRAHD